MLALCWIVFDCFSGSPRIVFTFDVPLCVCVRTYVSFASMDVLGLLAVCVCAFDAGDGKSCGILCCTLGGLDRSEAGANGFFSRTRAHDFVRTNAVSKHRKEDGSYSKTHKRRLKDSEAPSCQRIFATI